MAATAAPNGDIRKPIPQPHVVALARIPAPKQALQYVENAAGMFPGRHRRRSGQRVAPLPY
jgi:hypothetical protein